jgi:hypothetical protein
MSITGNGLRVKCVKSLPPRPAREAVADVPQSLRTHVMTDIRHYARIGYRKLDFKGPGARLLVVRVLRFSYRGLRRRWELRNDLLR